MKALLIHEAALFILLVVIMVAFFGGLILVVQATERWSPWALPPVPRVTTTPTNTPTSTSIPTSTPTSTATVTTPPTRVPVSAFIPIPEWSSQRVRVTWYGEALRGGPLYCGSDIYGRFDPDDLTTVAVGAGGPPCGSRLQLCSESACIITIVKDRCGGCGPGHLDLSQAGWEALGRPSMVDMTIQ